MKHIVGRQKVGILRDKHAHNLNIYLDLYHVQIYSVSSSAVL